MSGKFTHRELEIIAEDLKDRNIERRQICKAHVTACGLRLARKDLNLGNRVGSAKATTIYELMSDYMEDR